MIDVRERMMLDRPRVGTRMVRVNKTKARRLWAEGKEVYLQSCKSTFTGWWSHPYLLPSEEECEEGVGRKTFDALVNEYEYHNCDYERGYYAHYYVQENGG